MPRTPLPVEREDALRAGREKMTVAGGESGVGCGSLMQSASRRWVDQTISIALSQAETGQRATSPAARATALRNTIALAGALSSVRRSSAQRRAPMRAERPQPCCSNIEQIAQAVQRRKQSGPSAER